MPHPAFANATPATPALGGWVTFDAVPVVELLTRAGFDYIGIDTQHGMLDVPSAAKLLYAAPIDGPPVIVRVPANNGADIGKLLDCGADGIIVPMVNSAAEAAAAVAACRYAPDGVRSFGPVRPHIGRDPAALQARVACFVMIETVEALEDVEAIVATPGLTGVYLGPADLAVSMGLAPGATPTSPALREAQQRVAAACARVGIIAGCHGLSAAHAGEMVADGYGLISLTADKGYMLAGAAAILGDARKHRG
jgi:4-hydroxy-2-oxoheptanedioate aldolase